MRDLESSSDVSSVSKTLFSKEDLVENEEKTMEVIWTSVQHFKSTGGKIPGNIYQLFNFKRHYFFNIFLPRLVKVSGQDNNASAFLKGLKTSLKIMGHTIMNHCAYSSNSAYFYMTIYFGSCMENTRVLSNFLSIYFTCYYTNKPESYK